MKMLMSFLFLQMGVFFFGHQSLRSPEPGSKKVFDQPDTVSNPAPGKMFIDVYHFGKANLNDRTKSQGSRKELRPGKNDDVQMLKTWIDKTHGDIYRLSIAPDSQTVCRTQAAVYGRMPDQLYEVTGGKQSSQNAGRKFFLDVHELGAGNVTAEAVEEAHQKDLLVEKKYGVNLLNYWVDAKKGVVMCFSQAFDSTDIIKTHREAHGLLPSYVIQVEPTQKNKK